MELSNQIIFRDYINAIDKQLRDKIFKIYKIEIPIAIDLGIELEKIDEVESKIEVNEFIRVVIEIFDFTIHSFEEITQKEPAIILKTEYGLMNVTKMDYDDFREKPDWIFMEFMKNREDNVDLFGESVFEFLVNNINHRPFSGYIFYPNSDAYSDYKDIGFSQEDWTEACGIYSSLLAMFKICIHLNLRNKNLLSSESLQELSDFYGYYF